MTSETSSDGRCAGFTPTKSRPSYSLEAKARVDSERQQVKIVLVEPYFDLKTPESIGRATGAQVLMMPPSVGGVPEASDYFKLFDYDINLLTSTLKKVTGK